MSVDLNRLNPLPVRLACLAVTGAVVVVGVRWVIEAGRPSREFGLVAAVCILVALVPVSIFAIGARGYRATAVGAVTIPVVTALVWIAAAISGNEFALVLPMVGWGVTLGLATWSLAQER